MKKFFHLFIIVLSVMYIGLLKSAQEAWVVTIINKSAMTLVAVDEIIERQESKTMVRIIPNVAPNNQVTFQWPTTIPYVTERKITIYGQVRAVESTNKIIIGNTPDATISTKPNPPSGDFTIFSPSPNANPRFICVADMLVTPPVCKGR